MRRRLRPVILDDAREPLTQLVREDWIWRGKTAIDGVFASREGSTALHWRSALAEHLPAAESILETEDAAIILFRRPQTVDCDQLGNALPLRRLHGTLTSFPFKTPVRERAKAAIDGSILFVRHGNIHKLDISSFREADLSEWYDTSSISVESGSEPPRRPGVPDTQSIKMSGQQLFDQAYADSGLRSIRQAVEQAPDSNRWTDAVGSAFKPLMAVLLLVGVAAVLMSDSASISGLAVAALAAVALIVGLGLVRLLLGKSSARKPRPRGQSGPVEEQRQTDSRWLPITAVAIVVSLIVVATSTGSIANALGVLAWLAIVAIVAGLLSWIGGRIGFSGGEATADKIPSSPDNPEASPRQNKGALRRFFEKLLQKTPLADLALGKYDRRVAELKRLFDEGRIEEALKKSLALGGEPPPDTDVHADAPIAGPGIRERLEIKAARGESAHFLAALPSGAREELEALYREHASRCIDNEDYEHAAFILAELLDDAEAAVKVFSDAGQFAVAARLAQGRRLSPSLFIVLWYRAGEHQRALRLAERHDAYELLLETTDQEDETFRSVVRRAWSDRLAAVGNYTAALTVSEPLSSEDEAIAIKRHEWIVQGLAATPIDAELIARAAKALGVDPAGSNDTAMAAVQRLAQERDIEAARQRKRLADLLLNPRFEADVSEAYRTHRLPRIADQLTRQLLVDHANHGLLNTHQLLSSLADAGGQTTLAADIRRLPPVSRSGSAKSTRHVVIGSRSGARAVVAGAPMRGGRSLLAYEDGSLQLFDSRNDVIWSDQLWRPRDIVPIAPGRFALVIRDEPRERRLSIVDTETHSHADIGPIDIEAWALTATGNGWLVYANKQALNLRLDQLLAPLSGRAVETLEYHWATPITIEGRVRALLHAKESGDALWLFERPDQILECWCVAQKDLSVSYWALWFTATTGAPAKTSDFQIFERIDQHGIRDQIRFSLVAPDQAHKASLPFSKLHVATGRRRPELHDCLPVMTADANQSTVALISSSHHVALQIAFEGAQEVSMREAFAGDVILLWDDCGRVVRLATETAEIAFANAALTETRAAR